MASPVERRNGSSTGVAQSKQGSPGTVYEAFGTGASSLDRLLDGGFPSRQISLVYGKANSGKTIVSMSSAITAAHRNVRVFYVDTDKTFSTQRLPVDQDVLEHILLFHPEDFAQQTRIIESLENLLVNGQPALVIVDSITTLYRVDSVGPREALLRNRELNRQLAYLSELAARFPVGILLTGQVHSHPAGGFWTTEPVADRTLRHWANIVLQLRQTREMDIREAKLEKNAGGELENGPSTVFRIKRTGIMDA